MNELMKMFESSLIAHIKYTQPRIQNGTNQLHYIFAMEFIMLSFKTLNENQFGEWLYAAKSLHEQGTGDSFTFFSSPYKYKLLAYYQAWEIYSLMQKRIYGTHQDTFKIKVA